MMPRFTPPENPIDSLLIIAEQLRCLDDAQHADWLMFAIRQHIDAGESMDRALGLAGSLGRSPRFEYLRRERNRYLAGALWQLDGDYRLLAAEIGRFERRLLPAWRHRKEPDPEWSAGRIHIHAAFRAGIAVPATADGLRKALAADE